ncbi:restriction endonuclease subunit S [Nonomuraea bangladeshensis]|uniref:restriction endonuclease subunit S n=1 Tax=Nonomuraea bangladeshensis TaxID=404385 RepID=UPI003C2D69C3
MRDLPGGWKSIRLRDAGTWLSGGTPSTDEPRFWGGTIPWISAASMKDFYIRDSDRRLTKSGASAGTRLVDKGSVLFVVRGMSLKKEFRVGVTERQVAFGQDCKAIVPRQDIDGTFLALALKVHSSKILGMVDEAGHGTGRLPTDMISGEEIWIPRLCEQRRIVDILDALDAQISTNSQLVNKLRLIHRGLTHDIMMRAMSSATAMANAWTWVRITEAGSVKLGRQRSPQHETGRHMVPYLRVANVFDGYIDYSDVLSMNFTPAEQAEYGLRAGDILLNEGQSLELVGRSAVFDGPGGYCFQNTLVRFRPLRVSPEYAQAVFSYWLSIGEFARIAKQTTSIAHLGADRFARMNFPVAPVEEEGKIVASLSSATKALNAEQERFGKLNILKKGLMEDLLNRRISVDAAEAIVGNL